MKRAFLLAAVVCVAGLFSVCASGDSADMLVIAKTAAISPSGTVSSVPVSAVDSIKSTTASNPTQVARTAIVSSAAAVGVTAGLTSSGTNTPTTSSLKTSTSYPASVYNTVSLATQTSALGFSTDNSVNKTKTILFEGNQDTLTYRWTINKSSTPLASRSDTYGTYDEYIDSNKTVFDFLHGTDKLFCVLKEFRLNYTKQSDAIPSEQAENIGIAYVKNIVGDLSEYQLQTSDYIEDQGIYVFTYDYKIAGINTDDQLIFWVTAQGNPVQFSTFYRGRYDKYKNISADIVANQTAMTVGLKKLGFTVVDFTVNKPYLTLSDSGKLQLVFKPLNGDNSYAMDLIYTQKS